VLKKKSIKGRRPGLCLQLVHGAFFFFKMLDVTPRKMELILI
jgi:hypothetical protein